ncbi:MAG: hypothetical protein ACRBBS_15845 [Thalassovita sp.]
MSDECFSLQYAVEVEIDEVSGNLIRETWRNEKGDIDRSGDLPAITSYCPISGRITEKMWYRNSKGHRENQKPAVLRYDAKTGKELVRGYRTNGLPDREVNQPTAIYHTAEGKLLQRSFYVAGKKRRTDGPALETFDEESGALERQEFWIEGLPVEPFV